MKERQDEPAAENVSHVGEGQRESGEDRDQDRSQPHDMAAGSRVDFSQYADARVVLFFAVAKMEIP